MPLQVCLLSPFGALSIQHSSLECHADEAVPAQRHKREDDADLDKDGALSVRQVLGSADPAITKPLWTLVAIMLFQQLSCVALYRPERMTLTFR